LPAACDFASHAFPIHDRREAARHPAEHRNPETALWQRARRRTGEAHASQPARLAYLDDGNDRGILVRGDVAAVQVVPAGTPSVSCSDDGSISLPPFRHHLASGGATTRTKTRSPKQRNPLNEKCAIGFRNNSLNKSPELCFWSAAHGERAWWAAITDITRQCYSLSRFGFYIRIGLRAAICLRRRVRASPARAPPRSASDAGSGTESVT
jgi:hypothetical protein